MVVITSTIDGNHRWTRGSQPFAMAYTFSKGLWFPSHIAPFTLAADTRLPMRHATRFENQGRFRRLPRTLESVEIFSRPCLRHRSPQQRRRDNGSCRQDQKTFPIAQCFEKKAGCGSADRSGDGDQSADEPAY